MDALQALFTMSKQEQDGKNHVIDSEVEKVRRFVATNHTISFVEVENLEERLTSIRLSFAELSQLENIVRKKVEYCIRTFGYHEGFNDLLDAIIRVRESKNVAVG